MSRTMQATPDRMVENGRIAAFGHFERPFRTINIMEADIFGVGRTAAKLVNPLRLKEWQHFAVFGPDFLLTFVVLNTHYLANSFCYFVDRKSGEMIEYHREGLPTLAKLARELWNDRCSFQMRGYSIGVHNYLDQNVHTASIDIAPHQGKPGILAEVKMHADLNQYQPLIVVLRLAENRPAYSHKMACPASGRIRIGERSIELDPARCLVLIDVHKAYYPYRMAWRWASCAGFDEQGRVVGLNLTHNVIQDDEENNENGLWVGRQLSMFGAARFTFNEKRLTDPWRVETTDGRCQVDFKPEGERTGVINAGVVYSNYHQPYGTFSGQATDDAGQVHLIRDYFGVTECHKARF